MMQLSKQEIDPKIDQKIREILFQVITDLKTPEEAKAFTADILTEAELTAVAKRLAIAQALNAGNSYEAIRRQLKVSSATIASVQDKLNREGGLKIALKKISADQWASDVTGKIMSWLKLNPEESSPTER